MQQKLADLFQDIKLRLEDYVRSLGLDLVRQDAPSQEPLDVTALIYVHGVAQGGLLFTVEQSLANQLAHRFMVAPLSEAEAKAYSIDVIAEIANIVSANALTDERGDAFAFGLPFMIATRQSRFMPGSRVVHRCGWVSPFGHIHCSLTEIQQPDEMSGILTIC